MKQIFQLLIVGLLAIMAGFVAGIGVTLALGLPWLPIPSYMLNIAGIFMIVVGLFTMLASSEMLDRTKWPPKVVLKPETFFTEEELKRGSL